MSERARRERGASRASRLGVILAAGGLLVAAACGGDSTTGPNGGGGDAGELNLAVGESQVVDGGSDGLRFSLPGPGDGGAEYRLAVQSAARSAGATAMRLSLEGGGSSSSSVSARRSGPERWRVHDLSPEEVGQLVRQRLQSNAAEMLRRRGIEPSKGYEPGVRRNSRLPTGEVPAQGDTLEFWFGVQDDGTITCDTTEAEVEEAVVRAVGEQVAMVEDTDVEPTTSAQMNYDSLASEFDSSVFGLDVDYFGAPTDIDGNQRVLVLFTRKVNEFSAAQEGDGFVGGFFSSVDLADSGDSGKDGAEATFGDDDSTPGDGVCDASNEAEIMWLLAPDPTGTTGEEVDVGPVKRNAAGTSSHEFQHMLNAANRVVKNEEATFTDLEQTWLDEGLSHIAEEIVGINETGNSLRDNLTAADVLGNQQQVNAFNTFLVSDFANAARFMKDPNGTQALAISDPSPIQESLKMRGYAWILLRWLADQEAPSSGGSGLPGSGEEQMFRELAGADGSLETGIDNIEAAAGAEWPTLLADFAAALTLDDDVPEAADRQQVLTWHLRDIYRELNDQSGSPPFDRRYPLAPTETGFQSTTNDFEVQGGGERYFTISSSGSASGVTIDLTDQTGATLTAGEPQITVVRVR